jgi:hypothetical protein
MKTNAGNLPPSADPIFLLFRYRPAQASPLRSEASRALRFRAKKSEILSKKEVAACGCTRYNPKNTADHSLF